MSREILIPNCEVWTTGAYFESKSELEDCIADYDKNLKECEASIEELALMRPEDFILKDETYKSLIDRCDEMLDAYRKSNHIDADEVKDQVAEIKEQIDSFANRNDVYSEITDRIRELIQEHRSLMTVRTKLQIYLDDWDTGVADYIDKMKNGLVDDDGNVISR